MEERDTNETGSISLEQVSGDDLHKLYEWLKSYLPHSWRMCQTLRECLQGRWTGQTWLTLQSQDTVLAVGEGIPSETSKVSDFMTKPRTTCFFSPDPVHAEMLLTWPGFIDWSQPCIIEMLSADNADTTAKVCQAMDSRDPMPHRIKCVGLIANPGDIELRPVPPDLEIRSLDPEKDAEFIGATWKHSRAHADIYARELIKCFPSVGLYDKNGKCLGYELGVQDGTMGLLYVSPEVRGRGLGKIITSQLADKYFTDNLPMAVAVDVENTASVKLHQSLGFKVIWKLEAIVHVPADKFTGYLYGY